MAVLKYRDKYGNLVALNSYKVNNVLVTNEKGQSQGDVMSQKAVTDELNRIDDEISDLNGRMEGITGEVIDEINDTLAQKADKSEVTAESNRAKGVENDIKSDISLINDALADCATTDDVDEVANQLTTKANKSEVYTKAEIDGKVSTINTEIGKKANSANVYSKSETYTKTEVNNLIPDVSGKANTADVYTKNEIDTKVSTINTAIAAKASNADLTAESNRAKGVENEIKSDISLINDALADCATTDDVAEVENQLTTKANKSEVYSKTETYTKTEVDAKIPDISGKANTADVYTKSQVDTKDQSLRDLIIANADAIAAILADDYFTTGIIDCGYI